VCREPKRVGRAAGITGAAVFAIVDKELKSQNKMLGK
jgi:hypothetical protein